MTVKAESTYTTGHPDIDEAARYWAATLPPMTPSQRATIAAVFGRAADQPDG